MTRDELIEQVKTALRRYFLLGQQVVEDGKALPPAKDCDAAFDQMLALQATAALQSIEQAGLVIVPREPTIARETPNE